jgi:hypothetical protein
VYCDTCSYVSLLAREYLFYIISESSVSVIGVSVGAHPHPHPHTQTDKQASKGGEHTAGAYPGVECHSPRGNTSWHFSVLVPMTKSGPTGSCGKMTEIRACVCFWRKNWLRFVSFRKFSISVTFYFQRN